ncbi:hypothetical protein ACRALDRAFT_1051058 [Sodiomyces alcalophilus JCM 7366]|uniref:uncharacterized protein n=1 Tax=Sodiomyces alcalophilus JCM 7366 TaxID=591952 RepID=UPI0039B4C6D0
MSSSEINTNGPELSAAQRLLQTHAESPRHVTVEEVPDEDLPITGSHGGSSQTPSSGQNVPAKVVEKPKEDQAPTRALDTQSHELFPELGASKPRGSGNVAPIWGAKSSPSAPANGISRSSTPSSGVTTPRGGVPSMVIPGRNVETVVLDPQYVMPRSELRRPIPDIIKDINRKSRANITMSTAGNGRLKFDATGQQDVAQQALKDLVEQIGTKTTIRVPIPQVARAHIIGKQGSTIKALQEKSGARIKLPKAEEVGVPLDDDDDATIDVLVEGNALSAASARNEILKIAGERAANINVKLRDVPAQFYPFLVGPDRSGIGALENEGVHIRVPPYQAWSSEPLPAVPSSGQRPQFFPATQENLIQLAGQREAVHAARAELQRRAAELREQLLMEQFAIQRGRHQFIIGSLGVSPDAFLAQTGCTICLPSDEDNDMITVIGPKNRIEQGMEHAMDLAMNMQSSQIDISRFHKNAPDGAAVHARHITRFLRQRDIISELERAHNTHITTPRNPSGGALAWELYARDGKDAIRAQSAITGVIHALPPSRITTVPVDPFFHAHLRKEVSPRMTQTHGVQVVLPGAEDAGAPVLLVFEGPSAAEPKPQIKTGAPTREEEETFQKSLEDAKKYILDIINKQESIASTSIDVPQIFHERLRRFIKKEQEKRSADQIPIRVSSTKSIVTLRGPASAVETLKNKITAFLAQEIEDEKERGLITTFDFPQKFANHLIGKNGSHISELRDKFDVEIQVDDGKVQLKGPKAKAEAAKSHINSLARGWADETTHVFRVEPKFHRELIGAGGSLINRLQNKYKVHIFFPKPAKSGKDDDSNGDAASDAGKPRRQQAPDEVTVRGPKKGADEARDEILSLVQYYRDNSYTATVTVQQRQVPSLIGQGGAALDELRQSTGAKIDIPGTRDTETVDIQIKGGKAEVAAAKKALEEKKAIFEDTIVKTIEVEKKFHKDLIGPGGAILRDIVVNAGGSSDRRELARTIQFPKQDADGNGIKIEGRTEVVNKICARIEEIVAERQSQVTEVMDVPIEKHRSLIGRGGETKRQLESQLGVSIDIPRQGDGKTGVKLTGLPDKVAKAKEHISSLVKEQEGETVMVPRNLHHAVSNNGQIFRQLRNNHQVTVGHDGHTVPSKPTVTRANGGSLPLITDDEATTAEAHSWKVESLASTEEGDIPWVLRGSPENVEKAKAAIANALAQARKSTTVGLLVLPDPTTYRYVIGQGGSKVNSIRKQTGCKINVPRNDSNEDAIEITGSPEGVEKAKDLILEAVQEGLSSRSRD